MSRNTLVEFCLLLSFLGCVAGCNVQWVFADRQAPEGPLTSPTHPDCVDSDAAGVDVALIEAREVDLVEEVLTHRAKYHRSLEHLREYYGQCGSTVKQSWARYELDGLRSVKPFKYLLDAEIPSESLSPTESIVEADTLFEEGRELMRRGGHGVPALYREDLMVEAAKVLRELILRYPTSDKIDDAAYLCGEIHEDYLPGQEEIAVRWYERTWLWNPDTPLPARFQAATIYDYRLHDRDRALELYNAVTKFETAHTRNVRFATRRIHELTTGERTAQAKPSGVRGRGVRP